MGWAAVVKAIFGIVGMGMQLKLSKMSWKLMQENLQTKLRMADQQELAGQLAQKAYEADAAMIEMDADSNALAYEKQALDVENEGYSVAASQRVAYIKSGVDMSGSPLLVSRDTIAQAKAESEDLQRLAKNVQNIGGIKANQSRTQGRMKLWESQIAAGNSRVAAYYDLAAGALGLASSTTNAVTSWGENMASSFGNSGGSQTGGKTANVDYTSVYDTNYIGVTKQNQSYADAQWNMNKFQSLGNASSVQRTGA